MFVSVILSVGGVLLHTVRPENLSAGVDWHHLLPSSSATSSQSATFVPAGFRTNTLPIVSVATRRSWSRASTQKNTETHRRDCDQEPAPRRILKHAEEVVNKSQHPEEHWNTQNMACVYLVGFRNENMYVEVWNALGYEFLIVGEGGSV